MKYNVIGVNYVNGYKILHIPDYPKSTSVGDGGWQYEHMVLMEEELGRLLEKGEHVHHLDGNRGNNRKENLVVLSKAHHARIHKWMESIEWVSTYQKAAECAICRITLQDQQIRCCSTKCENIMRNSTSQKPSKEELLQLTSNHPFTKIGIMFGVSDNAVRKWCKYYGIPHKRSDIIGR